MLNTKQLFEEEKQCAGRVYRYEENNFFSDGRINMNTRFVPLKKLSCGGCELCGGFEDAISEECYDDCKIPYPKNLNHGDTVSLIFINDGRGFEDLYDEYHLEFVRYKNA